MNLGELSVAKGGCCFVLFSFLLKPKHQHQAVGTGNITLLLWLPSHLKHLV